MFVLFCVSFVQPCVCECEGENEEQRVFVCVCVCVHMLVCVCAPIHIDNDCILCGEHTEKERKRDMRGREKERERSIDKRYTQGSPDRDMCQIGIHQK